MRLAPHHRLLPIGPRMVTRRNPGRRHLQRPMWPGGSEHAKLEPHSRPERPAKRAPHTVATNPVVDNELPRLLRTRLDSIPRLGVAVHDTIFRVFILLNRSTTSRRRRRLQWGKCGIFYGRCAESTIRLKIGEGRKTTTNTLRAHHARALAVKDRLYFSQIVCMV